MKLHRTRLILWLLVAALVIPLLPVAPFTSHAASSIYFQFNNMSTDPSAPKDVNSNIVDVAGTFSNVTASTISYKVIQVSSGQTTIGSTRPTISGNKFQFTGVNLYDGLNQISIIGVNTTGNTVNGDAFVNFNNVPAITDIKLTDGTPLPAGTTVVTSRKFEAVNVKTLNATEVTINGQQMIGGSGSTYVLSNMQLQPGLNKMTIIARNATKTYELTRYLAYYNGSFTAYDVMAGTQPLDGKPTFSTAITPGQPITGKVIVPGTGAPNLSLTLDDNDSTTPAVTVTDSAPLLVSTDSSLPYRIYSFTTGIVPIATNGDYTLTITDTTKATSYSLTFKFRDASSPYIKDVKEAYDVTGGAPIVYTSYGSFPDNSSVVKTPFWLLLDTGNFDAAAAGSSTTVTAKQGATAITSPLFTYTVDRNQNNQPAIKITNLPSGTTELTFTVKNGTQTDSITRNVTFVPVPAIQLDNIYDGKSYDHVLGAADVFIGKLINFNLGNNAELNTLKLSINGVEYPLLPAAAPRTTAEGVFTFKPSAQTPPIQFVPGPNTLIFKGVAGGVPVSTTLTLYYFTNDNPSIANIRPVPFVLDPTTDTSPLKRQFNDIAAKFVSTAAKQYNTNEKKLDLLFDVQNASDMEIQLDGNIVAKVTAQTNPSGVITSVAASDTNATDGIGLCFDNTTGGCSVSAGPNSSFKLRLWGVGLPQSGPTNMTMIVRAGTVSANATITVIRDLSPFIVLSPKLPEESVINANFLKVSIKAEGANQVLIGKTAMVKGQGDIFRYELKNLKPGVNTVKFTVTQGTQKLNGSFQVNYAADNSITAQYKAGVPKSGKLSVFNKDLELSFPKNTFLRQANRNPGQDVQTVDLFDAQEMYFGIADRTDGRTVKKYNAVGMQDSAGNFLDGSILNVYGDGFASDRLRPSQYFNFASNVFWVDAGYFKQPLSPSDPYTLIDAAQPYAPNGDIFYTRLFDPNKWLESSQRGVITLKYDANIRDALAVNLSVWRYTAGGWQNVGGVVNTKNNTVSAPFDGFGYYSVMALRYSFSDILGHEYARFALETMFSKGIMTNKSSNSFGVYDNITRGEFAQMIVRMLDIPLAYDPNNMTFDDVLPIDYPDALWNYRYVETAVKRGFVRGKSPRLFFPNDTLTRQEASIMMARALNLIKSNADPDKDKIALQKLFTDANTIDYYGASAVMAIAKAKFISGIPNTQPAKTFRFEPDSSLKRADAAIIAQKVLKSLKKL